MSWAEEVFRAEEVAWANESCGAGVEEALFVSGENDQYIMTRIYIKRNGSHISHCQRKHIH